MLSNEFKTALRIMAITGIGYVALNLGNGNMSCDDSNNREKPIVQTPTPTVIWPTQILETRPTNTPISPSANCLCPTDPFKVNDLCYGILAKGPGTQCICPCPEEKK
jgi:hypothetical protein